MTHPLTDKICLAIDDNSMIDEDDWMGYMRAGADWQMEQVIEWLKSQENYPGTLYYELPTLDCESIECAVRHAMRPTGEDQEDLKLAMERRNGPRTRITLEELSMRP
tara:strand:+ start:208 stop:528 length:321 start_codon:yes stop_codon:yes gene_type:complete